MTPLLDVHTHSIMSGHAYSSLQEMAMAASEKGLQILGITEHAPELPGACDPIYFRNLHVVPRQMYGVRLLLGAELNILDTDGTMDLDEEYYRMLSDDKESVAIAYRSELSQMPLADILLRSRERDLVNQFTTSGVHRDDVVFRDFDQFTEQKDAAHVIAVDDGSGEPAYKCPYCGLVYHSENFFDMGERSQTIWCDRCDNLIRLELNKEV